jgi:hypothetical protein
MSIVTIVIVGGIVVLILVGLLALMFMKSNQVNLTGKTDEKPEWMSSTPPAETMKATLAENEGVTLYNQDADEKIAAPFAEQIEDILRAKLDSNPFNKFKIDLGTSEDGSLEIWVNGTKYSSVNDLPDEELKQAFLGAVKKWEEGK